ncbi:MAG: hypothetical protein ACI4RR_06860 [Eubacterium sp.]
MDKNDLLKYLSIVKDIESRLYMLKTTETALINRINFLGIPNKYNKPNPPSKTTVGDYADGVGGILVIIGIVVAPIAAIISFIHAVNVGNHFFATLFRTFLSIVIPVGIIGLMIYIFSCLNGKFNDKNNYSNEMAKYNTLVEQDEIRVKQEKSEKSFLYHELTDVQNTIKQVEKDLDKAYSVGIIYESYRNFCAVTSFYEYLASGICDTLEGPNGAVKLYRNEMLQGRIIDSLQSILDSLESIKINQETLYLEVLRGNQLSQKLLESSIEHSHKLDRLTEISELQATNQDIIKSDVSALTWISAYNSKF